MHFITLHKKPLVDINIKNHTLFELSLRLVTNFHTKQVSRTATTNRSNQTISTKRIMNILACMS